MHPGTPIKNETAGNAHFVDSFIHVHSSRETPAPDSQSGKELARGDNIVQSLNSSKEEQYRLKEENQALKRDLILKFEENEALNYKLKDLELKLTEKADKVRSLELKLEDLELRIKLCEEAKKKEWCFIESSNDSLRDEIEQGNEKCVQTQLGQSSSEKTLDLAKCLVADPGVSDDDQFCHKKVEVVDNVDHKGVGVDSAKSDNLAKWLDLDRIVDLACGKGLSHAEGVIKAKEAVPSTVSASRKQRILSGLLSDANKENDIVGNSGKPRTTELGASNLLNEMSFTEILHEEDQHLDSQTSKPLQNVVFEQVPFTSSAPRGAIGSQCFREDDNKDCMNGFQEDGHGGAKVNGESLGKMIGSMMDVGAHVLVPEMQHHVVETSLDIEKQKRVASKHISLAGECYLNAKQIMKAQSHSSSATSGPEIAVKAKSGFRQMVLQSDSESESGNIHGTQSGRNLGQAHLSNGKKNDLPPMSSDTEGEKTEGRGEGVRSINTCTSGKASQPHLRRSKRLNLVYISDQSDDVIWEGENEQSNCQNGEIPKNAATVFEAVGVDGITDGETAGVRRRKRLRKMSNQKSNNSLQKESMCAENFSSSGDGTPVASKAQVKRKEPLRTRKRLFEEVESRPYGNNHSLDSEENDSEIESDADSLAGFIAYSEDRESSGYSSKLHSSSSNSYAPWKVYRDQRRKRDINLYNYVWELEVDMLFVLATDLELCLRAVCALNRRQTEDEQKEKISKYKNKRGFDKPHATKGSRLAEFLTNGDISGPVKKSVADLEKFDAGGLEFCRMLASKHSKQLFETYTNAEDPHFPFA